MRMKWKRMGTWNSGIGFNYDDLFPCTVGVDLFPCCADIHGIVSFHVETIVVLRDKKRSMGILVLIGMSRS